MKNHDHRDEVAFAVEHDPSECDISEAALEAALSQPFTVGALLREEVEAEIEKRDGEWNAFTHQIFRRVDQAELELERKSLEERAVAMLKEEVEHELADMAPRFDRDFAKGIEAKIWRAARERRPTIGERFGEWIDSWKRAFVPRTVGALAMAGVAAALIVVVNSGPTEQMPQVAVSVDRVSFEGNVTVLNEDGNTIVWLADASS
jgi:hypothetical protein